ncbi:MAG: hypothetical protein ABI151_15795 [Chitinophagaceae bacterium]
MKTFNRHFLFLLLAVISITLSCQKNAGGGAPPPTEQTLAVTTNPLANGHVEAPAPGPTFNLNVTITSAMPATGVKIDVSAKPDGGTINFFSATKTTTSASNDFVITGATASVVSVATITVTSLSTATNTYTGSYKFSRK